jgi:hypothetical protein
MKKDCPAAPAGGAKQGMEIETIMRNNKKRDIYFRLLVFWALASWVAASASHAFGAPTLAQQFLDINATMVEAAIVWWFLFVL